MVRYSWHQLVLVSLAGVCAAGITADGVDASPSGAREGSAAGRLHWRTVPYGQHRRVEYGGDLVALRFQDAGFALPVEDDDWDVLFTYDEMTPELASVPPLQKPRRRIANHCGYFLAAGQKCYLALHVHHVEHAYGRDDVSKARHLLTYMLSKSEQAEAWKEMLRTEPERRWVVKGCSGGASEDVRLVGGEDAEAISAAVGTHAVAQEYVRRPAKPWGDSKWHMRIYVLVTSWAPTRAFFFQDGFVLVKREHHNASNPSQADLFSRPVEGAIDMHSLGAVWSTLGLQRAAKAKENLESALGELFGTALRDFFGDFRAMSSSRSFECFDLFGLDVIIGEDLAAYVLEVNKAPNLWGDAYPVMWAVKGSLVRQIAAWAARKARHPGDLSAEEEEAIENATLVTFTRIV